MIPKEKALELCYKFMISNSYQAIVWYNARICASIAVDEIINECGDKFLFSKCDYWQEVKQEIEKL